MSVVVGIVVAAVAVRLAILFGRDLMTTPSLVRTNYRGVDVSAAGGVLLVATVLAIEGGRSLFGGFGIGNPASETPARALLLFTVVGFGLLGLVDDSLGTPDTQGFRGHLAALARGRMTTGAIKLGGGAALAVIVASLGTGHTGRTLLADALVIALAANLANLLDRAPGRAGKFALVAYVPLAICAGAGAAGSALAPVIGATIGLLVDDLRERLMLGDAGANALGAALGVGAVLVLGSTARTIVLVALVGLNALAELLSFTTVIERVPPLRWFDRAGRRRDGGASTR